MRALVLAGGGSKGSWQAGAIKALSQDARFFRGFDYISGTSVGAINAAALAMYNREQIVAASAYLTSMWSSGFSVWRLRFPPYISGLWNPSLGVNNDLRKLLDREIDVERIRNSNVHLNVTAVDMLTGDVHRFDGDHPEIVKAIRASASFPIAFPPEQIGDGYYTDGGVRDVAPLKPVIDAGADEITVILTGNPYKAESKKRKQLKSVIDVATRVVGLMADEIMFNDIRECLKRNKQPTGDDRRIKLRVLHPSSDPLADSLDFDKKTMIEQIERGCAEAKLQLEGMT